MKLQEIKEIAKKNGIKAGKLSKAGNVGLSPFLFHFKRIGPSVVRALKNGLFLPIL